MIKETSLRRHLSRDMKDKKEPSWQGVRGKGKKLLEERKSRCLSKAREAGLPDLGAGNGTKGLCVQAVLV